MAQRFWQSDFVKSQPQQPVTSDAPLVVDSLPSRVTFLATCRKLIAHVPFESVKFKYKIAQECSDEDANDDVPVKVHRQQHDEVCHGKLKHVEESAEGLLEECRTQKNPPAAIGN